MTAAVLASLVTLLLVGGPAFLAVLYLRSMIATLAGDLAAERHRGDTQEIALAKMRCSLAKAWGRVAVAVAEGWAPHEARTDDAPPSRPATPPPESRSRA